MLYEYLVSKKPIFSFQNKQPLMKGTSIPGEEKAEGQEEEVKNRKEGREQGSGGDPRGEAGAV